MANVSLTDIRKTFGGIHVLKGISLDIADGEFLTLLGPSGCGKSTLLRIIAGLETHDGGSVSISGRAIDHLRPKHRDVAMVFQTYALYPHLTVSQNIALPLRMRQLSYMQRLPLIGGFLPGTRPISDEIASHVLRTAKSLEIDHLLDRKPGQLSGGQRQRVAVGRAMVRNPLVFLMDEPLSNLDAKLRVTMRAEIKELHRRLGVTFIYVTHDQAEAMTLSDRVAVMLDGSLLQVAPPQAIFSDPANLKVASFIGSPQINLLSAIVRDDGQVDTAGTILPIDLRLAPQTRITLGIRPEALTLTDRQSSGVISGRTRLVEHLGSDLFLHLDLPGEERSLVIRTAPQQGADIANGATVHVTANPDRVLIFDAEGNRLRSGTASVTALRSYTR